jgi:hypothetical protein
MCCSPESQLSLLYVETIAANTTVGYEILLPQRHPSPDDCQGDFLTRVRYETACEAKSNALQRLIGAGAAMHG